MDAIGCRLYNSSVPVKTETFSIQTQGHNDILDVTSEVQAAVDRSDLQAGTANVFVPGSTAGFTTVEFEPGLVKDLKEAFEKIAPAGKDYHHHATWGDDNGNSHVRASLLGPGITVPFTSGRLILGSWQQVILVDFDTRPRKREIVVQLIGE